MLGFPKVEPSVTMELAVSFHDATITMDQRKMTKFEKKYLVFYVADPMTGRFVERARTNVFCDPAQPQFKVEYFFNSKQTVKFTIYVVKQAFKPIMTGTQPVILSTAQCSLGELIRSGRGWQNITATGPKTHTCRIKANELSAEKEKAKFSCQATLIDIENTEENPSKLFCIFYRRSKDSRREEEMYMSEVIVGETEPAWKPFSLPTKFFHDVSAGQDWALHVVVASLQNSKQSGVDRWSTENCKIIGETSYIDYNTLKKNQGKKTYHLLKEAKNMGGKNKETGRIMLTTEYVNPPSFLDYIDKGMEMNFVVAIDFTAANGKPDDPLSLHFINEENSNEYSSAIEAVGNIIQDYDSDKLFPVFGFGAQLPDGTVSHNFPCNFTEYNPLAEGVDGIIKVYQAAIRKVKLSEPTHISPIIELVSGLADYRKNGSNFIVLLILTKGDVDDLEEATKTIIESSELPMSVIIVGVGNRDFTVLKELGEKGKLLEADGEYCKRDIVHFVHYRNPCDLPERQRAKISKDFAANVMLELPDHVLKFMEMADIKPGDVPPQSETDKLEAPPASEEITVTVVQTTESAKPKKSAKKQADEEKKTRKADSAKPKTAKNAGSGKEKEKK